jgi:hypothetical protein
MKVPFAPELSRQGCPESRSVPELSWRVPSITWKPDGLDRSPQVRTFHIRLLGSAWADPLKQRDTISDRPGSKAPETLMTTNTCYLARGRNQPSRRISHCTVHPKLFWQPNHMFFVLFSAAIFAFVLFLVWKHNHSAYQKRLAEWDSPFICSRCGTVSQH